MKLPTAAAPRLRLIVEVAEKIRNPDAVGPELVALMANVASGSLVDVEDGGLFHRVLSAAFATRHPIWTFIRVTDEDQSACPEDPQGEHFVGCGCPF
jgi:hypothetical protein